MNGIQIENLLKLMEGSSPFNPAQARREVLRYLTNHMGYVATQLEEKGEAVIQTSSGSFRLTKADLIPA